MGSIKEAFTFDDVTLAPNYSEIMPSEVITETVLSKHLTLKIPLLLKYFLPFFAFIGSIHIFLIC